MGFGMTDSYLTNYVTSYAISYATAGSYLAANCKTHRKL
jgi:hypothetical protein